MERKKRILRQNMVLHYSCREEVLVLINEPKLEPSETSVIYFRLSRFSYTS